MDVITFVHQPRTRHKSSILDPVNQTLMGLIDDFIFRRPWFPGKSPQLPEEKGNFGDIKFDAETIDEIDKFLLVGRGESRCSIRLALVPEDPFERSGRKGEMRPLHGVVPRVGLGRFVERSRHPGIDGRSPHGTRNQADGDPRFRFGHRKAKSSTKPHPDHGRFVEMKWIDGRNPPTLLIEHEHPAVRFTIGVGDFSPPRHIRLPHEEKKMEF